MLTMLVGLVTISLVVILAWLADSFAKRYPTWTKNLKDLLTVIVGLVFILLAGAGASYVVGWAVLGVLGGLGSAANGS